MQMLQASFPNLLIRCGHNFSQTALQTPEKVVSVQGVRLSIPVVDRKLQNLQVTEKYIALVQAVQVPANFAPVGI